MTIRRMTSAPLLGILALLALLLAPAAPARAGSALTVDIYGPGQRAVNMAFAKAKNLEEAAAAPLQGDAPLRAALERNLSMLPFLDLMPDGRILGGVELVGVTREGIDFKRFQVSKADLLLTTGWRPEPGGAGRVELRVYEVFSTRLVTGKAYQGVTADTAPLVADMFCAALMTDLTGNGDFFRSAVAFTKKTGDSRDIWVVRPQGRDLKQVTYLGGSSISPAWSLDGRYVVFGHHGSHSHTLGVWDAKADRVFRAKLPGETIGGTAFAPDNRVVVAMSRGNMDIYKLTPDLTGLESTLVDNWAIDVSPSFSRDGKRMAFVSDRQGSPQVYLKDLETGKERRLTFEGKYNTSPSLSPDGRRVVFSRLTPDGHRVMVMEVDSGRERQITFGPGKDEEPAFAPDGYFVCFASNRRGGYRLYLTTIHGDEARRLETGQGDATHPAFGLVPGL